MPLSIERRLRVERDICAMKHDYLRACDAKDADTFRASFVASGGKLNYGPLGKTDPDGMAEIFRQIALAEHPDGGPVVLDMHHAFMPTITVTEPAEGAEPTHATGTWTLQFRQVDRLSGTEYLATGEYRDVYVVEEGRWVMSECDFTVAWSIKRPLGDAEIDFDSAAFGEYAR